MTTGNSSSSNRLGPIMGKSSKSSNRSYENSPDQIITMKQPIFRWGTGSVALLYTAFTLCLGVPLFLVTNSIIRGNAPWWPVATNIDLQQKQERACVLSGEYKEANLTLILPEFALHQQREVERLFVDTYNSLSGACEGPYQRVLTEANLLWMESTGHYRALTSWHGWVSCHGCSDVEPFFLLVGLNRSSEDDLIEQNHSNTGHENLGYTEPPRLLVDDLRKKFVKQLQSQMQELELVPPQPASKIDRRYLEESKSKCKYDIPANGGTSDGKATRKLQMRPSTTSAAASEAPVTVAPTQPERAVEREDTSTMATRQPEIHSIVDPDCDDRRHFFWIPEEEAPSSPPTERPSINRASKFTLAPSLRPSSAAPSSRPTLQPLTIAPSMKPTTLAPSAKPSSSSPSFQPTTLVPTLPPSTLAPSTTGPSMVPSSLPTASLPPSVSLEPSISTEPSVSSIPSHQPSVDKDVHDDIGRKITLTPTVKETASPTSAATSAAPSLVPSGLPTRTATESPTERVTEFPSGGPTFPLTGSPSETPTMAYTSNFPTLLPSSLPSLALTEAPTESPTAVPTTIPTQGPTVGPSQCPTIAPSTLSPTLAPSTLAPSTSPTTSGPTFLPSGVPTIQPTTEAPTVAPTTGSPTVTPTTQKPTAMPVTAPPTAPPTTQEPTAPPTTEQPTTQSPTVAPTTLMPTVAPTTLAPTMLPTTLTPTAAPTTLRPTLAPSTLPPTMLPTTLKPTPYPSAEFTAAIVLTHRPTHRPTPHPTTAPPTEEPTIQPPTSAPPTQTPTMSPTTLSPTDSPTTNPTVTPSVPPTLMTQMPTIRRKDPFAIITMAPSPSLEPSASVEPSFSMQPSLSEAPSEFISLPPSDYPSDAPMSPPPVTFSPTTLTPTTLSPTSLPPTSRDVRQQFFWIPKPECDDRRNFYWIPLPKEDKKEVRQSTLPPLSPGEVELKHHCIHSEILEDEDFEGDGSEDPWTHGSTSYSRNFSFFLGRLDGEYNPMMSREFDIVPAPDGSLASNATLEFVLYIIDDWGPDDSMSVMIGDTTIHFGPFESSEVTPYGTDTIDGISWWRNILMQGSNLGFGRAEDQKHLLEFSIPSDHFPNGKLHFEVRIETKAGGVETLSAGIDDFILEAYYNCRGLTQRSLLIGEGTTTGGQDASAEEAKPYCSADNFPCAGGPDMVFICHYTNLGRHKTLCIPERSSRILQYYVHDYCGPCVGNFRGTSWH